MSQAAAKDRPNVILCMGDDHGWDETGYNGHPHLRTPVLDEMARTALRCLFGPCDRVHSCATATAVGGHLESARGRDVADASPRVNAENNALRTEALACLGDQRRVSDRGRIDADLVRPRPQQTIEVLDRSDTATDSERNKDALRGALNNVIGCLSTRRRRCDVQEDEFVGALVSVGSGKLDRISCIAQVNEVDSLHDPTGIDVEARNHPNGQTHGRGGPHSYGS